MADYVVSGIAVSTQAYELRATAAPTHLRRDGGAGTSSASDDFLDETLRAADFRIAADFALAPTNRAPDRPRRGTAAVSPVVRLDVPIASEESAVLLVEDDAGLLSWHLPEPRAASLPQQRGMASAPSVVTFRLEPMPRGAPTQARRRGPIGEWIAEKIAEPVRVRVLRFLVSKTIDAAVSRIEGNRPKGPVVIKRGLPLDQWVAAPLAPDRPAPPVKRILLLVHGTFSSTAGGFAGLAQTPLLEGLFDRYDLVLGHDHHTLADDPRTNAEAILASLHALDLAPGCTIDAIAHSRGGLVLRTLAEVLLPQSGLDLKIDRAVFVGCTNGGTLLAEPQNWEDLVNIYTNVLVSSVKAGAALLGPAAAAASPWISYAIGTIGRFVQMLPQAAISERRLPGLAAMEPDGETVQSLNSAPSPHGFSAQYFAISSNFEPGNAGSLKARAALFLADRALDRLLREANDLVVHTRSMTQFGADRAPAAVRVLDTAGHIYHTIYFFSDDVTAAIAEWLEVGAPRAAGSASGSPGDRRRSMPPLPSSSGREPPSKRGGMAGLGGADNRVPIGAPFSSEFDAVMERVEPAEVVSASIPAETTVERYIAAEMEPMPQLARAANVYVTISPNEFVVADNAAATTTSEPFHVRQGRAVELMVIPRSNCEIVGQERCTIDPKRTDEAISRFRVKGIAAGPAELLVEARQGPQTLASFLLRPIFVSNTPLRETQPILAVAAPDPDLAVLRIYEFKGVRGTTLHFDLSREGTDLALLETVTLPPDFDMKRYAVETFKEVEDAWNLRTGDGREAIYNSFLRRISNKAKDRTARLLPDSIRRGLWNARAQIRTIRVISEEAYIPWELLYLFDPDGAQSEGEGFFAERGLLRWLHNASLRRLPPSLAGATSRYVIPDYRDVNGRLPGAAEEKAMLERRVPGIRSIEATSEDVCTFLKEEAKDCTLLHFACHGEATQASVIDAALRMTELQKTDGTLVSDPLNWQDVKETLDFGSGHGPLVFINACQTGQVGGGIGGTAGFADAFIRPRSRRGAGAFIGALWSVDDVLATRFADTVYAQLGAGEPLVAAIHAAREATKADFDFTWLAYSVYFFT